MRTLLTCFAILFINYCFAQQHIQVDFEKAPLKEVFSYLKKETNLLFSYADKAIQNKEVTLHKNDLSIEGLLKAIEKQTGLSLKLLPNNQVIVSIPKFICGTLIDAVSKAPLAFAEVILNDNSGTLTNEHGFFKIEVADIEFKQLKITYVGYQITKINVEVGGLCNTFEIQPSTETLNEVVILSYVTSGIDRNKDGSLSIDSQKLGILPGLVSPDIAQSIQLVPGISTLDESATGIQIRGGSPDQNLVLFDNIKLYNTGYFYGMFSLFNPFSTQKASIYRSGTSAAYGDRISGIIDISSGEKIPTTTKGGVEIDGLAVNGYVKTPLSKKVGVSLFARRAYTDILKTPTYTSYAEKIFSNAGEVRDSNGTILTLETDDDFNLDTSNNEFSFTDLNAKVIFKPNQKNNFAISTLYTHNSLDFDFESEEEKSVDDLVTENKGISFKWSHTSNEKQHEEVTAYYSNYDSFYQNDELEDETGNGNLDVTKISIRENKIKDIGVHLSSTTQIRQNQQLKVGYQLSNTDLLVGLQKIEPFEPEENENTPQRKSNLKNALFGEYTFNLKNKGLINTGIRLVHYSSLDAFNLEPRINFEYPITKHLRIKSAIERRNQPISQIVEFDNTELRLENNLWRLSDNENFPLLTSNQISGGILYKKKNLTIDFDSYYKELDGLTTFTSGFSNPLENLEIGKSTIKGLDVLLKYKYENYRIWAGYTFNDITFKFPNLENTPASFPGNNDIKHQFRISNTLAIKNWQFSLGWQIRSGKPVTPVNSFEIKVDADGENAGVVNFGSINSDRLPTFHRLDASLLYDFLISSETKKRKAQIGVSAINLYNRVKPLDFIYKAEVKPLDDGGIPKPGTSGATPEEREVILEQVIQRFSLGFTPNIVFRMFF